MKSDEAPRAGVIAIGASAGGLAAIEAVLAPLRPGIPWPIIIMVHGDPKHESLLTEILSKRTDLPVKEVRAGERVRAGVVYTTPSDMHVSVSSTGSFATEPVTEHRRFRIDRFLRSVSEAFGERAVAVILSGTGADGSNGALAVRKAGGCVIAESEDSAAQFGMPSAAIQLGAVDFVRPASEIGPLLDRIARGIEAPPASMEADDVAAILDLLRERRGTSFDQYRPPTVRRRIGKRMLARGVESVAEYRRILDEDARELDELFDALLINVTEFFRDSEAWDALRTHVLPELVSKCKAGQEVRVWSAGCSTGEEAYSIAILLAEALDDPSDLARVKVFATDLDDDELAHGRAARFDASRVSNVSPERLERFFVPVSGGFEVAKSIRRMIVFGAHDLTRDPPIGRIDLVICRNVLIYFGLPLQERIASAFHYALREDGFLFLGRSEMVPRESGFDPIDRRNRLFQRQGRAPAGGAAAWRAVAPAGTTAGPPSPPSVAESPDEALRALRSVIDSPSVALFAVDAEGNVSFANRFVRGVVGSAVPLGKPLKESLPAFSEPRIVEALEAAVGSRRRIRIESYPVRSGTRTVYLDLTVESSADNDGAVGALVHGLDVTAREEARAALRERSLVLQETVEELQSTNEDLQGANEEMVTANEELQSANEELATLNEELQSTNEEMVTANEELQSTNEELEAVNSELEQRTADVESISALFDGVMQVSSDAIVVCDPRESVILWNTMARDFFGLRDDEAIGRNLFSIDLLIDPGILRRMLREASESHKPAERKHVPLPSIKEPERRVTVKVHHVRGEHGEGTGWAIVCKDSTAEFLGEAATAVARALYGALLRGTESAVLVVTKEGRITEATPRAKGLLGIPVDERPQGSLWDYSVESTEALMLRGAIANLTSPSEPPGEDQVVTVRLRSGTKVDLKFVSVHAADVPPLVVINEVPEAKGT